MDNGMETPLAGAKPECLECSEPGQALYLSHGEGILPGRKCSRWVEAEMYWELGEPGKIPRDLPES